MKPITIRISEDSMQWLEDQVREGRFASISHGMRYAIGELIKKEEDEGK